MTSVVDASYRKISPAKPPVLSPKPAPSEIVKRLSFKRDGLESPRVEPGGLQAGEDKSKVIKAGREEPSTNGTADVVPESRVSSMIARLSNGARPEELNTSPGRPQQADRKQFLSKFINNNEKEKSPDTKLETSREKTPESDLVDGDGGLRNNKTTVELNGAREKPAVFEMQVEEAGQQQKEEKEMQDSNNGLDSSSPAGARLYTESSSPGRREDLSPEVTSGLRSSLWPGLGDSV